MARGVSSDGFRAALALPALAVLAVAFVLLGPGKLQPVVGARIRGGPTDDAGVWSWRVEVVERFGDVERPIAGKAVTVAASLPGGVERTYRGVLDDEGAAAVSIDAPRPSRAGVDFSMHLDGNERPVAEGHLSLSVSQWTAGANHRGGWVEGSHAPGRLFIRAAAARGVFAVPFRDPLIVEVRRGDEALAGVQVRATSEGADVSPPEAATDARGRATFWLTPQEHAVAVALRAIATPGDEASLDLSPAVVPGALHVTVAAGGLVVESPVARDRAYVALVGETERVAGGTVRLVALPNGVARGQIALPIAQSKPLWAVVSSEPELGTSSLVGWPLGDTRLEPASTFDVRDALLWEGMGDALRKETARARRVRSAGGGVSVLLLAASALLIAWRAKKSRAELEAGIGAALPDEDAARQVVTTGGGGTWLVVAAVLCVALAGVLVFVLATWR